MILEERLTRKLALKRVKENLSDLKNKSQSMKSIYEITFKHENFTFFNEVTNTKIIETSYKEADRKIQIFANYFKDNISGEENYVGLLLENSPTWIYSFYGLLMSGFVPVLLSTKNGNEYVENVCKRLGIKTLISDQELGYNIINPFKIDLVNITEIEKTSWKDEIIFTTSGTTGECKIVSFTGSKLCEQINNASKIIAENYLISKSYNGYLKHLVILPLFHVFGFIAVFLWFSFFNVTFVFPRNLTPNAIRQAALMGEVTHIFAVPLFWKTISSEIVKFTKKNNIEKKFNKGIKLSIFIQKLFGRRGIDFVKKTLFKPYLNEILGPSICFCINGGAFLDEESFRIINGLGYPLVNGFGSTEVGITSFVKSKKIKDRMNSGIGFPFEGIKYSLVNYNGCNELVISGKSLADRVMEHNEWEGVSEKGINSNDVAVLKKNGYFVSGRKDEIYVNKNGENYFLPDFERSIHLSFADSYIVFFDKEKEKLTLLISYLPKTTNYQISNDIQNMKKVGFDSKISRILYTFFQFPKANEIKIQRNLIEQYFYKNPKEFFEFNAIEDKENLERKETVDQEILRTIMQLFKDVLNVEDVHEESDFYHDLGGDSLRYFMLLGDIQNAFDIETVSKENVPTTPLAFTKEIMKVLSV